MPRSNTSGPSQRMLRVGEQVRHALSDLLQRGEVRDDLIETTVISVSEVRMSPDLKIATAFVAPLGASAAAAAPQGQAQTSFQLQPLPTPGLTEYTIVIDGQILRYRNGHQEWASFSWPSAQGQPGAHISALAADGRTVEIADFPGQFGLEKLINSAQRQRLGDGLFVMSWSGDGYRVSVNFRMISEARAVASGAGGNGLRGLQLPPTVAGVSS